MEEQDSYYSRRQYLVIPFYFWVASCIFVLGNVLFGIDWEGVQVGCAFVLVLPTAIWIVVLSRYVHRPWSAAAPCCYIVWMFLTLVGGPVVSKAWIWIVPSGIAALHIVALVPRPRDTGAL